MTAQILPFERSQSMDKPAQQSIFPFLEDTVPEVGTDFWYFQPSNGGTNYAAALDSVQDILKSMKMPEQGPYTFIITDGDPTPAKIDPDQFPLFPGL